MLLQWCLVNARAKRAFEAQSSQAMRSMAEVSEQVRAHQAELGDALVKLEEDEYNHELDMRLGALGDAMVGAGGAEDMDTMLQGFKDLSQSIYSRLHHLPTDGITVDHPRLLNQLEQTLQVLQRVNRTIEPYRAGIATLGEQSQVLSSTALDEVSELHKARALLTRATDLENKERSQRISCIQNV